MSSRSQQRTGQKIVEYINDETVKRLAESTIAQNEWYKPQYDVRSITTGPAVCIEGDKLRNGYVLEIGKNATSFPPKGILPSAFNRQTDLFVINKAPIDSQKSDAGKPVTKFSRSATLEVLKQALSEDVVPTQYLGTDKDNSVTIGLLETRDDEGYTQTQCCIIVDTDGGNPSYETDLMRETGEDSLLAGNAFAVLSKNVDQRARDRQTIADRIVERLYTRSPTKSPSRHTYYAVKIASNASGVIASPVDSAADDPTFLLYIGMSNTFKNRQGTMIKDDAPGGNWYLYKGAMGISSSYNWNNNFRNAMPHSFGYYEERTNAPGGQERKNQSNQHGLNIEYKKAVRADLEKVVLSSGANTKIFNGTRFAMPDSQMSIRTLTALGFQQGAWDRLTVRTVAQRLVPHDVEVLPLHMAIESYDGTVTVAMDKPIFVRLLAAINALEKGDGIRDAELLQHIEEIFPTKVPNSNRIVIHRSLLALVGQEPERVDAQEPAAPISSDEDEDERDIGIERFEARQQDRRDADMAAQRMRDMQLDEQAQQQQQQYGYYTEARHSPKWSRDQYGSRVASRQDEEDWASQDASPQYASMRKNPNSPVFYRSDGSATRPHVGIGSGNVNTPAYYHYS